MSLSYLLPNRTSLWIKREPTCLQVKQTLFSFNAGEIYLHDRSGARKSSGSYYTPDFAVEHLLDSALEPALDEHLERMTGLSDADRTEQFFDFRVADIAMGSGHFLVAAIDRIERRFALWLEENPTPGITRELQYLREAAKTELGELADTVLIEDGQLLRRMIARRCIYGVDLNAITVQLARLSIWIHTLSFPACRYRCLTIIWCMGMHWSVWARSMKSARNLMRGQAHYLLWTQIIFWGRRRNR